MPGTDNKLVVHSYEPFGYEGALLSVETDLRRGIPSVDIVGLADGSIRSVRERLIAAFRNQGLEFPSERVLMSLSPADLKKENERLSQELVNLKENKIQRNYQELSF